MKIVLVACTFFFCLMVGSTHADIVPKNMKSIYVSSIIENLGEYPDYTLVEIETLGDDVRGGSVIGPKGRIHKDYKLNSLHILAVPIDKFPDDSEPDWFALFVDTTIPRYEGIIEAGQKLVPRDSPLSGRTTYYRIVAIENGEIRMEKTDVKELMMEPSVTIGQFNRAFLFTFCIELITMLLLIRFGYRSKTPGAVRIGFVVLLGQTATLPVLWYLLAQFPLTGAVVFLMAEAFAVTVEGAIYKPLLRMPWTGAMLASLLCNALSALIGLWV